MRKRVERLELGELLIVGALEVSANARDREAGRDPLDAALAPGGGSDDAEHVRKVLKKAFPRSEEGGQAGGGEAGHGPARLALVHGQAVRGAAGIGSWAGMGARNHKPPKHKQTPTLITVG
jgi:hypothetical protein